MAAGFGSRYGGPKQFDAVGPSGETLLEYAAFDARRAGFGRLVLVVDAGAREGLDRIAGRLPADLPVAPVVQDPDALPSGFTRPPGRVRPWGTVHAVLAARRAVQGPFAVSNADDFYGRGSYRLAIGACAEATRGDAAVLCLPVGDTLSPHGSVARAVCHVRDGRLVGLEELVELTRRDGALTGRTTAGLVRRLEGVELASMNFWVFPGNVFDRLEERFARFLRARGWTADAELTLADAVGPLVADNALTVRVLRMPGPWFGLTHADDRPTVVGALRRLTERGDYPSPLSEPAAGRSS